MIEWYSSQSLPKVLLRGALALVLCCCVAYFWAAPPIGWVIALAVPALTTLRNIAAWRLRKNSKTSQQPQ
jgi:predicted membrane metal-binding protein